jgi:hypothetical protein
VILVTTKDYLEEWEQLRIKVSTEEGKSLEESEYSELARGMPASCICTYWRLKVKKRHNGELVNSAVLRSILFRDPERGILRPWRVSDGIVSSLHGLGESLTRH